ncbi:MAG: trimeric intracellular cation channel family protein [Bacteroidetes bacterium]|nr:trimeric intracellular cation channel family protein [Bacteroidota bacterium]MBT3750172.1 trimeric intracellular cation channel family protein [Bacteroidota bacterium]MBT4399627.1 trimeric intracellular cation channel family protein [Bacteroidota bacterium]MBT4409739.1 trimeric intracellular cation channel family protein [Bacteroidota bacterium]MBT7093925.1 trimeric intracellular cation channel family protein [Bacteroidota bacterium]
MEEIVYYIAVFGTIAFAISGALHAMNQRFDPFGVFIIGFATAVGGGTVRDVLLGQPVFWLVDPIYIYVIIAGSILAIVFRTRLNHLRKTLLFFDTIGLGLYTIIGVQIGLNAELDYVSCVALGTLTGSFGGVLRDILINQIPVIFKKEIYATVSILGGSIYILLQSLNVPNIYQQLIPSILIIVVRFLIIYFKVSLPTIYRN